MFRNIFKRDYKVAETPDIKLEKLNSESESILSIFHHMIDRLKETNSRLNEVAEEAKAIAENFRQMAEHNDSLAEKALIKAQVNNKIIGKIASIVE